MAMKLRLARHGRKGIPFFWLMAADARCRRETGKEKLGTYDPCLSQGKAPKVVLNKERIQYWLSCGAQPTDRVRRILSEEGILPKYEFRETPKKSTPGKKALERKG
ncbi:30S ribosomal protein S16 [Holospora obtusa F1]|uniref:Small ribosomal subunit protein bS16 n=2 Tax=Holospora obtusa TaxID=49893 RepID=W6TDC1_HOLOB|nr:30S ribosomal protein S16 [Holospora obtusa F1]